MKFPSCTNDIRSTKKILFQTVETGIPLWTKDVHYSSAIWTLYFCLPLQLLLRETGDKRKHVQIF